MIDKRSSAKESNLKLQVAEWSRWSQPRLASLAAKGLMLATACTTAGLALFAPKSLTAISADGAGILSEVLATTMLLISFAGWLEMLVTDVLGRALIPVLPQHRRHRLCVLLYASLAGLYGVFAFAAMDPGVSMSWILIIYYVIVALCGAALAISIAQERRDGL